MQNRWKKAGCMRRLPYSQSCHPRSVAWMRSPAASCVRPEASRAAFTCSGVGLLAALPPRLRLGWLDMLPRFQHLSFWNVDKFAGDDYFIRFRNEGGYRRFVAVIPEGLLRAKQVAAFFIGFAADGIYRPSKVFAMRCDYECFHFISPDSPDPEARCKRSIYNLKYTRIAYNCKRFLKYFSRAQNKPSNAELRSSQRRDRFFSFVHGFSSRRWLCARTLGYTWKLF